MVSGHIRPDGRVILRAYRKYNPRISREATREPAVRQVSLPLNLREQTTLCSLHPSTKAHLQRHREMSNFSTTTTWPPDTCMSDLGPVPAL
jgi:hypothetical protein